MMKLSCKDVGVACDFEASADTEDELLGKMMEHGMAEHSDMLGGMSDAEKEDLKKKMVDNMMIM